ncbi:hypothetical protein PI125_g24411 [Phytophthora idaei]|nr:hypothetical protein PC120_g25129 [Phytophthora cactorum]KAG3042726.1 hypothetical protein PC121_g22992 [Phytophthora cactorum]KAG3063054.1 hypothetical protein PI125_g24411 [Phytophthora idaei]KAG3126126.1 hypothetical protein PI126_g22460 [Phytophthora idaei]
MTTISAGSVVHVVALTNLRANDKVQVLTELNAYKGGCAADGSSSKRA